MAPSVNKFEFVVLRLTFDQTVHPQIPHYSLKHKKHSPSGSMAQVRDWFDRVMSHEKVLLPPNAEITYAEWRIQSGNSGLFKVNKHRFERIMFIMSEDIVHWIFFSSMHRRLEGSSCLPLSYCSCCLNTQYMKIIDAVKDVMLIKPSRGI